MADENKPTDEPVKAAPATPSKDADPGQTTPFVSASDQHDMQPDRPPIPGLSYSAGLQEIPGSEAPAMADGTMVPHVFGPGQAAVDPIAAGLDWKADVRTRNESRVVTQTGELGAGPRPATYAEKSVEVPQAAPADGTTAPAPKDAEAQKAPGPSGASAAS